MRDYINIQADEVTISKVVDRQQSRTLFSTASQRACVCVYIFIGTLSRRMAACKLARLSANTAVVAHRNEFIYVT